MKFEFDYPYCIGRIEIVPIIKGYAEITGHASCWWVQSIYLIGYRYDFGAAGPIATQMAVEVHDGDSMHNNIADWLRDECGEDIQARLCVEGKASPYADDLNALQLALVSDGRDTVDDNDEHRTYWGRP